MKKITALFLILLCLLFATPVAAANVFKEGFYKVSDFNPSPNNIYSVQNISSNDEMYVLVFDQNQNLRQSIRLEPTSSKYQLLPMESQFRIIIVGKGEVFIN